jgi:dTDP-glucose 4,6-dehydratase/UDP-glucose 4-epimerase
VAKQGECKLIPFPPERKKIDIGDFYSDYSLIRKELGWSPKVGLKAGLSATIDYYRQNGSHYW